MEKKSLKDQFKELKNGSHVISIYKKEGDCIKIDSDFIIASIENNERCVYIEGNISIEKIKKYLKKKNIDITSKIYRKQIVFLNKDQIYNNDLESNKIIKIIKNEAKNAVEDGYKTLNVIGEISWLNDMNFNQEKIINYEKKIDRELFDEYSIKTLCKYQFDLYEERLLKTVIELHPYLVWQNTLYENPYYISIDSFKNYHNIQIKKVHEWLDNIEYYKKEQDKYKFELAEEKDKFEFLFNQVDDALFVHGVTDNGFTNFEMVNEQAVKQLGYTEKELLEMQPKDIDSSKNDDAFYKDKYEKLIRNNHVKFVTEHVTKNGHTYPVENKSHLFVYKGKKLILTIARDITDRVKKEKELKKDIIKLY
ncbi:MAG: MEDS domain-containing protein [Halanaerobiales bacterium]|nr:MEDS domain-containing protein [Halanaerobiales bacterium]